MAYTEIEGVQHHNVADILTALLGKSFISHNIKDAYEQSKTFLGEALSAHTMSSSLIKGIINYNTSDNYFLIAPVNTTTAMDLKVMPVTAGQVVGCEAWKVYNLGTAITAGTKVTSIGAYGTGKTVITLNNVATDSATLYWLLIQNSVAAKVTCNNNLSLVNGSDFAATAGLPVGNHVLLVRAGDNATPTIDIVAASDPGIGDANTYTMFVPLGTIAPMQFGLAL